MTISRVEQIARALCEKSGRNPDAPMLQPDGLRDYPPLSPMWTAFIKTAKKNTAAFDLSGGCLE